MVAYHLLFDCYLFGWLDWDLFLSWPMVIAEKASAYSFILCAGVSSTLTRSNVKRGLITLAAGFVVIAASFVVDAPIYFGILQFLGIAMILYAALGKWVRRVPAGAAPFLWIALFVVFQIVTDRVMVDVRWLFWLGFQYPGFVSYDYFPLLPYIFLFFLGSWMGQMIAEHWEQLHFLERKAPGWLTWPGRRTLWIYLIHQPVLYGICWLISLMS